MMRPHLSARITVALLPYAMDHRDDSLPQEIDSITSDQLDTGFVVMSPQ
jgi:hypothetical protein